MTDRVPEELARAVNTLAGADPHHTAEWFPEVYHELRRLAAQYLRRERKDHTLQATALVHEVYLLLMKRDTNAFASRQHFFRAAAMTMRHLLLKHARDRRRIKRGGARQRQPLDDATLTCDDRTTDLLALDEALQKLAVLDPWQAGIVELRFFSGLSVAEVAEVVNAPKRSVEADWTLAKAWLWRELQKPGE